MKVEEVLFLLLFFAVAAAVIFLAPFSAPYGTYTGLDGAMGIPDHRWDPLSPDIVYALGDMMCHQQWGRSLVLNGSQMPFCARCSSIVVGAFIGASALTLTGHQDMRMSLIAGMVLLTVPLVDWAFQFAAGTAHIPSLIASGMAGGIGLSLILYAFLSFEKERGQGQKP